MAPSHAGSQLLLTARDGQYAYLTGPGASPEGERPFLDRFDLTTMKAERVWRSDAPYYEQVVTVLDADTPTVLTRRESMQDPPNSFVRDGITAAPVAVTTYADPEPELAEVQPQLITYSRADGVQLSAKLYLPPGYAASKGPLPFLVWAYPSEFKDAAAAAQVKGSPHRFVRPNPRSADSLLQHGSANRFNSEDRYELVLADAAGRELTRRDPSVHVVPSLLRWSADGQALAVLGARSGDETFTVFRLK